MINEWNRIKRRRMQFSTPHSLAMGQANWHTRHRQYHIEVIDVAGVTEEVEIDAGEIAVLVVAVVEVWIGAETDVEVE